MKLTSLYGKTYAWVQATQTGQWRLVRFPDPVDPSTPWADPDHDVLADLRAALGRSSR